MLDLLEVKRGAILLDRLELAGPLPEHLLRALLQVGVIDELRARTGENGVDVALLDFTVTGEQRVGAEGEHSQHLGLAQPL